MKKTAKNKNVNFVENFQILVVGGIILGNFIFEKYKIKISKR